MKLYTFLQQLYDPLGPALDAEDRDEALRVVLAATEGERFERAARAAVQLGAALGHEDLDEEVRRAYHDLRGGSLSALLMQLDLVREGLGRREDAERVHLLVRDHLKMMRNAVCDLDAERYRADLQPKGHGVALLREKWGRTRYRLPSGTVDVRLHGDWTGDIAECCMEFSALDRVLYNLVNNAARHAADGRVDLFVTPIAEENATQLRLAVANRVTDDQRAALRDRFGDQLGTLFQGGFTTGGNGLGMRIAGEFVVHGYGLPGVRQAIDGSYVGAEIVDGQFVAWFFWLAAS